MCRCLSFVEKVSGWELGFCVEAIPRVAVSAITCEYWTASEVKFTFSWIEHRREAASS